MKSEKITETAQGRSRWYADACAAAHALDLLGERWALLVVRELMFSAKRFGDLRASLPGISANVLTQRLEGLEAAGVLARRRLPPPANAQVYELTDWGREAEPIFQALGRWGARSPLHDATLPFSATSLLLSLRTMLDPSRAGSLAATIGLRMDRESFVGHLRDGALELVPGPTDRADTTFVAAPPILAGLIHAKLPIAPLEDAGQLTIEGDRALALRFIDLFTMPPKAS